MVNSTVVITKQDETTVEIKDKFGTTLVERDIESAIVYTGTKGEKGDKGDPGAASLWRGVYSDLTNYTVGDEVFYEGSSYICILDTIGNAPPNVIYWDITAQKGDTGNINVSGVLVEVDFGTSGLDTYTETTVVGQTWLDSSVKLTACLYGEASGDRSPEDGVIEGIIIGISNIIENVGFTINAYAPEGASGIYKVQVIGG